MLALYLSVRPEQCRLEAPQLETVESVRRGVNHGHKRSVDASRPMQVNRVIRSEALQGGLSSQLLAVFRFM